MPQMWFSRSLSHEYPLQMETSHLQLSVDMFVAHVDLPNFYITHHRCQALQHWLYNIVLPSTLADYLSIIVRLLFRSLILERGIHITASLHSRTVCPVRSISFEQEPSLNRIIWF